MGSRTWLAGAAVAGVAVAATVAVYRVEHSREQARWGLFRAYCTDCHNKDDLAGNVSFQGVTPESVAEHPEVFEAAVRKLRGRLMPPPGNPQPKPADVDALIARSRRRSTRTRGLSRKSATSRAAVQPNRVRERGEGPARRRDRSGANTCRPRSRSKGFTNIAAALSVSPAFLEQYVDVASKVAQLAVGEPKPKVATAFFPPPSGDQDGYIDGMPLGTRGGMQRHAYVSGGRRVPAHDHGPRRRALPALARDASRRRRAARPRRGVARRSRRPRGPRARRSRRRAGARRDHEAFRERSRCT